MFMDVYGGFLDVYGWFMDVYGWFMDGEWGLKSDLLGYLVCKSDEKSVVGCSSRKCMKMRKVGLSPATSLSRRNWWI